MSQKFIIIYPGQGSQKVGMGKDLFESHRVAKQVFEEVDDSLGQCLSKIIFEGPKDKLTLTSKLFKLSNTSAAPPIVVFSSLYVTTGTGASGLILVLVP